MPICLQLDLAAILLRICHHTAVEPKVRHLDLGTLSDATRSDAPGQRFQSEQNQLLRSTGRISIQTSTSARLVLVNQQAIWHWPPSYLRYNGGSLLIIVDLPLHPSKAFASWFIDMKHFLLHLSSVKSNGNFNQRSCELCTWHGYDQWFTRVFTTKDKKGQQ